MQPIFQEQEDPNHIKCTFSFDGITTIRHGYGYTKSHSLALSEWLKQYWHQRYTQPELKIVENESLHSL